MKAYYMCRTIQPSQNQTRSGAATFGTGDNPEVSVALWDYQRNREEIKDGLGNVHIPKPGRTEKLINIPVSIKWKGGVSLYRRPKVSWKCDMETTMDWMVSCQKHL